MFPMYSSTQHYRLQHIAHHQFVNDPDRDPDVSQLQTSGHWLHFPVDKRTFLTTLLKQLWLPNLFRYIRIRAAYNAMPSEKNPYFKKGWKPNKTPVRLGIVYMLALTGTLAWFVHTNNPLLLAVVPACMYAAFMLCLAMLLPATSFHQSRVHPVIPMRVMSLMRVTYISLIFNGLAWLSLYVKSLCGIHLCAALDRADRHVVLVHHGATATGAARQRRSRLAPRTRVSSSINPLIQLRRSSRWGRITTCRTICSPVCRTFD